MESIRKPNSLTPWLETPERMAHLENVAKINSLVGEGKDKEETLNSLKSDLEQAKIVNSVMKQEQLDLQAEQTLKQQAVDAAKQALDLAKVELDTVKDELEDVNDRLNQSNDEMNDLTALVDEKQRDFDDVEMNYIESFHEYLTDKEIDRRTRATKRQYYRRKNKQFMEAMGMTAEDRIHMDRQTIVEHYSDPDNLNSLQGSLNRR